MIRPAEIFLRRMVRGERDAARMRFPATVTGGGEAGVMVREQAPGIDIAIPYSNCNP